MIKFLNYLKDFTNKQKKHYVLLIFLSLIVQVLDIVSITLIPLLVSLIFTSSEGSFFLLEYDFFKSFFNDIEIKEFIIIFILFFVFKNISLYLCLVLENNFFKNLQFDFQSKIFKNYIRKDYDFIQKNKYSTLQRNVIGAQEFSMIFQKVLRLIKEFILLLGIVLLLIFQDTIITLTIASVLFLFIFLFNLIFKKKYLDVGKQVLEKKSKFLQYLTEALNSFKLIFLYKNFHIFEENFQKNLKARVKLDTFQKNLSSIVKPFLEVIVIVFLAIIIFFYIEQNKELNSLVTVLALYSVAAVKIGQSLNSISLIFSGLKFNEPLFNEIAKDVSKITTNNTNLKNDKISIGRKVIIEGLEYSYPETKKKIFSDLNLEIFSNQLFGVIGKSGSGKSTLIDLFSGILQPDKGKILIEDNKNINQFLEDWHNIIGYIPQDSYILDDSLANNICFGLQFNKQKYEKIINILDLKDLHEREKKLQRNIVGDKGGSNLSGGQRQRISIARALYREAKILIFDEPTSALDFQLSKSLFDLLKHLKKEKMIIVISHEKDFLDYYDNYIDLNNLNR